jgi:hypothetical protein
MPVVKCRWQENLEKKCPGRRFDCPCPSSAPRTPMRPRCNLLSDKGLRSPDALRQPFHAS